MSRWPAGVELPALDAFFARFPAYFPSPSDLVQAAGKTPAQAYCALLDNVIRARRTDDTCSNLVDRFASLLGRTADFEAFRGALVDDGRALTQRRTAGGKRASLWGVTPIINLLPCAQADRLAGSDACSLVFNTYRISSGFDLVLSPQAEWVLERKSGQYPAYRWLVFTWAMLRFDNFFLFNDQGLIIPVGGYGSKRFGINLTEMETLRSADKAVFTLAYGADHRSRRKTLALGRYNFCTDCPEIGRFCICDDDEAVAMLNAINEYSTANLTTGLSTYYVPEAVNLNYLVVDIDTYPLGIEPGTGDGPLRILHCPNHPHFKGTHFLQAAIARLQDEGVPVEMCFVSGVSNARIREEMLRADVVADQFLGGMFGYATIEAMAMGRPVLCYLAHEDLIPDLPNCPVINASPDDLYDVLKDIVARRNELPGIGARSRRYVEQQFALQPFAERLQDLYRQVIPGYEQGLLAASGGPVVRSLERWLRVSDPGPGIRGEVVGYPTIPDRLAWIRWMVARYPLLRPFARAAWRLIFGLVGKAKALVQRRERAADAMTRRVALVLRAAARRAGRAVGSTRTAVRVAVARGRAFLRWAAETLPAALASVLVSMAIPLGRLATAIRMRVSRPRSLWGITPILTLKLLSQCDRKLGLRSESFVFTTYSVTSNFDVNLKQCTHWIVEHHPRLHRAFAKCVFAFALLRYDVFHYFFDRGIELPSGRMGLNEDELAALERAGKRLFVYTYGADVRTRERTLAMGKFNFCTECPEIGRFCICEENLGRDNTELVARYATAILAMGDMCAYVPGHREMHFWPIDVEKLEFRGARIRSDGVLRVAHATNQPWFKGTRHLVRVVKRLQNEGLPLELVSVSGLPNTDVLRIFGEVDLVAEQFLGGFHGYTALEAMAVGKPVISYIRDRERLADPEECPIISATPDELEDVLRDLVAGRYDFEDLGRRGRHYVEQHYAMKVVARELARIYLDCAGFPRRVEDELRRVVE